MDLDSLVKSDHILFAFLFPPAPSNELGQLKDDQRQCSIQNDPFLKGGQVSTALDFNAVLLTFMALLAHLQKLIPNAFRETFTF